MVDTAAFLRDVSVRAVARNRTAGDRRGQKLGLVTRSALPATAAPQRSPWLPYAYVQDCRGRLVDQGRCLHDLSPLHGRGAEAQPRCHRSRQANHHCPPDQGTAQARSSRGIWSLRWSRQAPGAPPNGSSQPEDLSRRCRSELCVIAEPAGVLDRCQVQRPVAGSSLWRR